MLQLDGLSPFIMQACPLWQSPAANRGGFIDAEGGICSLQVGAPVGSPSGRHAGTPTWSTPLGTVAEGGLQPS